MKIYVGCSLTHAPKEFRDEVEALKVSLRELGHEVFDFVGLVGGTPNDVYRWDIHRCVKFCDLFIAICDYPSIGLGYELGVAVEVHGKKVLAIADQNSLVTRLVLGIDHPYFEFRHYQNLRDIIKFVPAATNLQQMFDWDDEVAA